MTCFYMVYIVFALKKCRNYYNFDMKTNIVCMIPTGVNGQLGMESRLLYGIIKPSKIHITNADLDENNKDGEGINSTGR